MHRALGAAPTRADPGAEVIADIEVETDLAAQTVQSAEQLADFPAARGEAELAQADGQVVGADVANT